MAQNAPQFRPSILPYESDVRLEVTKRKYPLKIMSYAASKNKLVLWADSHCGITRHKYVKKLLKHIKVDIFGKCSGLYGQDNNCPLSSDCDKLFSTYKFYQAFEQENCICTDNITEKFWRTLRRGEREAKMVTLSSASE